MKAAWCDRTLIQNPCYFTLATSQKILDAELKKMKVDSFPGIRPRAGATTHFLEADDGKPAAIVCLFDHTYDIEQLYSLLAHEAVHIFQEVKKAMREENPSYEFEAYSIQQIAQQLFYEYKRQRKGKRK